MASKVKKIFLITAALGLVFFAGTLWGKKHTLLERIIFGEKISSCNTSFKFIDPQIACSFEEEENLEKMSALETEVAKIIGSAINEKRAEKISFFLRDLSSKKWAGINEYETFAPASLFKLPPVVAYLKLSETQPQILSQTYVFSPGQLSYKNQYFHSNVQFAPDTEYTVEEILKRDIIYSDNNAHILLWDSIDAEFLSTVIADLGFPYDNDPNANFMSAKTYANIFRILYNSSYLERKNSEKLLTWLNQADFNAGLVAGIPPAVGVSHKFGERLISNPPTWADKELHDCGIIYAPGHPYILCVMTFGSDYDKLAKTIADISNISYREMIKN